MRRDRIEGESLIKGLDIRGRCIDHTRLKNHTN